MKKTWEPPKLIVLVRTRPEESILSFCKGQLGPANNPGNTFSYCTPNNAECSCCSAEIDS